MPAILSRVAPRTFNFVAPRLMATAARFEAVPKEDIKEYDPKKTFYVRKLAKMM